MRTKKVPLHFGEHLMIDAYGGNHDKLNNKELVLRFLNELPETLGMKKMAEPVVYWAEPNHIKDPGGWTGVVVINESHISIHTFPKRGFLSADVYTCRPGLERKPVFQYLIDLFEVKEIEDNFVKRGIKYPEKNIN